MFAAVKPLDIDPETMNQVNEVGLVTFGILGLFTVGWIIWHVAPMAYRYQKENREAKLEAANAIWFDVKESSLHCGYNRLRIEPQSLEHFVCKISFAEPSEYHDDLDIFEAKDHSNDLGRGVEQAVRRLNKKASALGLKSDLLKRGKDSTSVNDEYRERIVQQ